MDAQCHKKEQLDHESESTCPPLKASLPIEKHAANTYTRRIFFDFQTELYEACVGCHVSTLSEEDGVKFYDIKDRSAAQQLFKVTVVHYTSTDGAEYSCKNFKRIGLLCRHILLAFNTKNIDKIPKNFIDKRWTKYAIQRPSTISYKDLMGMSSSSDVVKAELHRLLMEFNLALKTHGNNIVKVGELLDFLKEFNSHQDVGATHMSKNDMFESLIGIPKPSKIDVQNPKQSRNKGCGKRMRSNKEKMIEQSKKPLRKCAFCQEMVHQDSRYCPERKLA